MNRDGVKDWFLLNAPKRSHKGLAVSATITCQHICSLLSKKNLFLSFDDTNGIGTARYLLEQALSNTGWTLKYCETFYEADGVTEKVRSLKSENKRGAYLLISDICKLFNARPVFDGDDKSAQNADEVGEDAKHWHHHSHGEEARENQEVHGWDAEGSHGVEFLVDLHGADESSVGSADAA